MMNNRLACRLFADAIRGATAVSMKVRRFTVLTAPSSKLQDTGVPKPDIRPVSGTYRGCAAAVIL
jgi:hypothetical protein